MSDEQGVSVTITLSVQHTHGLMMLASEAGRGDEMSKSALAGFWALLTRNAAQKINAQHETAKDYCHSTGGTYIIEVDSRDVLPAM